VREIGAWQPSMIAGAGGVRNGGVRNGDARMAGGARHLSRNLDVSKIVNIPRPTLASRRSAFDLQATPALALGNSADFGAFRAC